MSAVLPSARPSSSVMVSGVHLHNNNHTHWMRCKSLFDMVCTVVTKGVRAKCGALGSCADAGLPRGSLQSASGQVHNLTVMMVGVWCPA